MAACPDQAGWLEGLGVQHVAELAALVELVKLGCAANELACGWEQALRVRAAAAVWRCVCAKEATRRCPT